MKYLKEIFKRMRESILGSVTVLFLALISFVYWKFSPHVNVPMWGVLLLAFVAYAFCIVIYAVCSASRTTIFTLPRVQTIQKTGKNTERKFIFLVEKNDLFTQGSYATITYQDEDDEIETILGLGYVESINTQGNLQVVFERQPESPQAKKILASLSNAKHHRNAVKVKPTISKFLIEGD